MAINTVQAIINGTTYNLTKNGTTGKYEATISAPSKSSFNNTGGFYDVTIKAVDVAGNTKQVNSTDSIVGSKLKLIVKEKVSPVITITSPTANAYISNNKPVIKWTVTDDDSGVDVNTIKLQIDSQTAVTGSAIIKTAITGGYSCEYTPTIALTDGSHTIKIDASDNDGNVATQKTVAFNVDTIPPVLSVTSPVDNLITNVVNINVIGTTNDASNSPVTLTIKHNSNTMQTVTVETNGSFTKAFTLVEGANTFVITSTDAGGLTTTVTRNVTLDTIAPTISDVTLTPNPVDAGQTYIISVTVTD